MKANIASDLNKGDRFRLIVFKQNEGYTPDVNDEWRTVKNVRLINTGHRKNLGKLEVECSNGKVSIMRADRYVEIEKQPIT